MPHLSTQHLALVCAATLASGTAFAADTGPSEMTLYRSDSAALYASSSDGTVNDGHAVVREQRTLALSGGTQDIVIGNLPEYLDPEAMALSFAGDSAKVVSQRLLLAQGSNAALTGLVGSNVEVLGDGGQPLASGTLLRAGDGLLIRSSANQTTLVRNFSAVRATGGDFPLGASLQLRVDGKRAGSSDAVLSYPTSGLGWRAAYVATLQPGDSCKMQFESRASIANRSGRDWKNIRLTLIAGEPNFAKASAPRPMAMKAMAFASADARPQQETLADYRSYTLPAPVDLPDGSVSQVPLYANRSLDCERTALYESGGSWTPPQPMLSPDDNTDGNNSVTSTLGLHAFDSLPAGYLRVLASDSRGTPQFIGEGRIEDTAKNSDATITLGTAFDLHVASERTAFHVDKAARVMDESFRLTLSNASNNARVITVREHPGRWREWTLASSSSKPSKQTTDTLEFRIDVPANGKATLDYAVRYHWSAHQTTQ